MTSRTSAVAIFLAAILVKKDRAYEVPPSTLYTLRGPLPKTNIKIKSHSKIFSYLQKGKKKTDFGIENIAFSHYTNLPNRCNLINSKNTYRAQLDLRLIKFVCCI